MRRIGGDGRSRGHGLEDHQAEGVGPTGEDEDIGVGEAAGQVLTKFGAQELGLGIFRLQLLAGRAVADDDLGARQVGLEKGLDILLDRHPADIEEERPGPVLAAKLVIDRFQVRVEQFGVDAARPGCDIAKAVGGQLVAHGRGGHHQPAGRLVEPLHIGVADPHRDGEPRRDVFRELGVVAGGEGQLPLHADAPGGDADGAFGRDMHRLGLEGSEPLPDLLLGAQGQADLRIGRARDGLELAGLDDLDVVPHGAAFRNGAGQGSDDAVDLGLPGVGGEDDAHGAERLRRFTGREI